ncbi:putative membrane protein, partial [Vibrio harveyi]
HVNGY